MRYKWMGRNDMSKRFGRNQKRKLLAEIARLKELNLDLSNTYNKGYVLSWPDVWTHFGMFKNKIDGEWYCGPKSPEYVKAYIAEKSCRYGLTTKTVAFFFFNEYFYKLVVINDPELARKLRLIKE